MLRLLRLPAVVCLLACAAGPLQAANASVRWLSFPKGKPVNASVTLLRLDGKVGRENAFFTGYRPQLRFVQGKGEVTCAIQVAGPQEKVEPGETAPVTIRCIEDFKVPENELSFAMFEGGRKVGEGALKPK